MLLGLFGWGLFSVAGTVYADGPGKSAARADRVRALQRKVMDLETIGRARVLEKRGVKPGSRPAVRTSSNEEKFAPVAARFVRFTVQATVNGAEPCLNTLEVYGPAGSANLTAGKGVRLTASSVLPVYKDNFKGGKYVPGWFWVSRERGTGWVQVELPAAAKIARIVWSRDAAGRHHDRIPSAYRIKVSEDGRAWRTVATGADRTRPGVDLWVSRSALVRALKPVQQTRRRELLEELRKLGAPGPNEVKSGPQVGEGVNGGFMAHGLNGPLGGKRFCPV
jgi:hypothetical protein